MQEDMVQEAVNFGGAKAMLWGGISDKVILAVIVEPMHNQKAALEELADWAVINEYQVLSIRLPGQMSGKEKKIADETEAAIRLLHRVRAEAEEFWEDISLFTYGRGAYISKLAFRPETFTKCLFLPSQYTAENWHRDAGQVEAYRNWLAEEIRLEADTKRLSLHPMTVGELDMVLNGGSIMEPDILNDIIRNAILNKQANMRKAPREVYAWFTYFRIQDKKTKKGIGMIGCKGLPDEEGCVEIGYTMARGYRNCGYMTEALAGFLDWLKKCPACMGVNLHILGANIPSWRVAEKCGFSYVGMYDIYKMYKLMWEDHKNE